MPTIGLGEILVILVVALFVIGPQQLPEAARTIGQLLHNLKRNASVLKDDLLGRHD
jgi:Tat protein translocase TatB subunit